MKRIQVCGGSGSGKTTLGRTLAARLGVPFFDIDDLFWHPGWRGSSHGELQERLRDVTSRHAQWVLAGNYFHSTEATVWPKLDTLVVLDLPLPLLLARAGWRTVWRSFTGERCCNGNIESVARLWHPDGVIRYTVRHHRRRRQRFAELDRLPELKDVAVHRLGSGREVSRFVAALPAPLATRRHSEAGTP